MFGLGMNEMIGNGQHKSILKLYTLPYIDRETCQEMYTDGFENYVTKDKFCTGYKLGKKKTNDSYSFNRYSIERSWSSAV